MTPLELRQRCHTIVPGHRATTAPAAETFAAMADWCAAHDVRHDQYGEGALIQAFERKVAALLGYPAAVFMPTGTLAQTVALRLACEARGSRKAVMHPTGHVYRHERGNYQLLDHFELLTVGEPGRVWDARHLAACHDRLGAALYELPMREIGGQLPEWEALEALKAACRARGVHLHLDGARLWEAAAGYGRPLAEVCAGFDSTYVSFYKGIGGMGGAMLLGQPELIVPAAVWLKRMGGNLWQRSPYVVAAAMQFDARLAQMPACLARTHEVARLLGEFPALRLNPAAPQVNLFHVHLSCSEQAANAARDRLAAERGIWLFGAALPGELLGHCYFEWYVGDNLLALGDEALRGAVAEFLAYAGIA
ncbi:threonine aldolase family protein [Chitinimonas koreensis]|uniref:threonine aldolase family protein n=1 Tax=Chitinimonas koreensis TaxID=356302 RepID=UPI00040AD68A|nr:beta-eliminating lyase-related protein [Chitinimonas koreensis]QNM96856.1 threonine aldolase [Chitinimonas koreensis]